MAEQTNVIDEIAVALGLDSSQFAADLDKTMKDAEDRAQEAADKMGTSFMSLSDADKVIGLQMASLAENTGARIEDLAESLAEMGMSGGKSAAQLVELAEAAKTAKFEMKDLVDIINLAGKERGVEFSPENVAIAAAKGVGASGQPGALVGIWNEANKAADAVKALNNEQVKGAASGRKMDLAGRSMSMGLTFLLRRLSPILVGFKIFGDIVKELNTDLKLAAASIQIVATNAVKMAQLRRQGMDIGGVAGLGAEAAGIAGRQGVGALGVQQAFGQVATKGAMLGLSRQQIMGLVDAGTTFARVYGGDATTAVETFYAAIEAGNAQALEKFGIRLDEARIYALAVEQELITFGGELTETAKQAVILNEVMKQSEEIYTDLEASEDGLTKQQQKMAVSLEATRTSLGLALIPFKNLYEIIKDRALLGALSLLGILLIGMGESAITAATGVHAFAENLGALWKFVTGKMSGEELLAFFDPKAMQERLDAYSGTLREGFHDIIRGVSATADQIGAATDDAEQKTASAAEHALGVAGLLTAKGREIVAAHADDLAAIEQNLVDTLAEINADYERSVSEAAANLNADLAAIDADFQASNEAAQREYYKTAERAAEDHAVAMRRLEEDTQLDLEDAVRDRDARAIREILKRYRIERDRREEDYQTQRRRRAEDYADQLAELRRQYLLRRAERQRQFEDEMAQAAAEKARREAEAQERYEKDMAALKARIIAEFDAYLKANSELLGAHGEMLGGMYDQLNAALGPGGWAEAFWQRYLAIIQGVYASIAGAGGYVGGNQPMGPGGGNRARGGTLFATGPTVVGVGEIPERVDITPMSRAGIGADRRGGAGREKVTVALNIGLDKGLVADIVDQSANEVAQVIVEVSKGRR